MKNIVITGGTDGMGKLVALHFLQQGDRVIVVGSTAAKGERFLAEAAQRGAADRASFLQADLSSVQANHRLIETIKAHFDTLDILILSAGKFQNRYAATPEGFEIVFATYYLSRYLLTYGLRDLLEKSPAPIIFNIAAPGINGDVQWDDLQFKTSFNGLKASFHGSRLNDLLAISFTENVTPTNIKYILYNPGFVRTAGVTEAFDNPIGRLIVKVVARLFAISPQRSANYIIPLLENPPAANLSAFNQQKSINLTMPTFNATNAHRLDQLTQRLLQAAAAR